MKFNYILMLLVAFVAIVFATPVPTESDEVVKREADADAYNYGKKMNYGKKHYGKKSYGKKHYGKKSYKREAEPEALPEADADAYKSYGKKHYGKKHYGKNYGKNYGRKSYGKNY